MSAGNDSLQVAISSTHTPMKAYARITSDGTTSSTSIDT